MLPRQRIARIVEKWLLTEPLLLATWTSHALVVNPRIHTIRVHRSRIECNPDFIKQLNARQLEATLRFEALRILLKHPYSRRQPHVNLSYAASNITVQEYLHTDLPFPRAKEVFNTSDYDKQFFEFYYYKLVTHSSPSAGIGSLESHSTGSSSQSGESSGDLSASPGPPDPTANSVEADPKGLLEAYADPVLSGVENADQWDQDELLADRIDDLVRTAQLNQSWGSLSGQLRQHLLANLRPRLDYRSVLRQFRTSILSQHRCLTRMKPNRRYGFQYMGSRRDFSTRLLFAVDVSGSMGEAELQEGFSVINRFFNYGIPYIDVLQFDAEITAPATPFRQAKSTVELQGRGGTNFNPVIDYIDRHHEYDGLIIFTDGFAPCPHAPANRRTRLLWLFVSERTYHTSYPNLRHLGPGAFLKPSPRHLS